MNKIQIKIHKTTRLNKIKFKKESHSSYKCLKNMKVKFNIDFK